jgi:outer membrane receptor protein involved in Fe transport
VVSRQAVSRFASSGADLIVLKIAVAALAVVIGCAAVSASLHAQTPGLSGTVRDPSGAVIPGAAVTATNVKTGVETSATTGSDGRFSLALPPGPYTLRAVLDGFSPWVGDVTIGNRPAERDVILSIRPYADTVVVTGTRSPEALRAAPVAMTVIPEAAIAATAAPHYGELLRPAPGVNTIELSARDVQVSTRAATGRNARTTLALLDGRTMYQDYFGMVLWDLVPVAFDEVKQVEVLRGPGSAIWGANALTGVVNILTKSPKEMAGTTGRAGIGSPGIRDVGLVHAAVNGRVSYKASGSFFTQDAWDRPAALPDGTALPPYTSSGTDQYKADGRVDIDGRGGERWRFDGGFASSSGLIVVAVGPFDARTLRQGYASAEYTRASRSLSAFFTAHRSNYVGLLGADVSDINSQLLQIDAKDGRTIARRHVLVYGGTFKHSHFDLSFVPDVHRREELGAFVTDDLFVNDRLRLTGGLRVDWFNTFGAFASPRAGARFDVAEGHTVRATYNRAYVAPSLVENFSDFPNSIAIPLPTGPFALPTVVVGDPALRPTTIDAVEIGYTGIVRQASVELSWYRNRTADLIQLPVTEFYTPATAPAGWPLPPAVLSALLLPKTFTWSSVGNLTESGFEAGLHLPLRGGVAAAATYSLQTEPDVAPSTPSPVAVNIPPRHRASMRLTGDRGRLLGSAGLSFTDRAFWTDVLAFQGWTDSFWLLDGTVGVRFGRGRVTWLAKGTNLADRRVQHHIFGDIIRRRLTTELRFRLPG